MWVGYLPVGSNRLLYTCTTPGVLEAIAHAAAILLAPSNPIVSVGPILAVPGLRDAVRSSSARKVAISPIVGGQALKGPADRMLRGLGHAVSPAGVARLYHDLVNTLVLDEVDAALADEVRALGMDAVVAQTVMHGPAEKRELARRALDAAGVAA